VQLIRNVNFQDLPLDMCLVVTHNISSNSIAKLPGMKLKVSVETYSADPVCT
jgi:hypothetical protein